MLVLELRSVRKARMTSRTATSAVNHISKDAVNTPWWCAPEKQPQTTPFTLCIAREELNLKRSSQVRLPLKANSMLELVVRRYTSCRPPLEKPSTAKP